MTGVFDLLTRRLCLGAMFATLLLSGPGASAQENPKDPYEGFNRAMFSFNEQVDAFVARPLAQAYDAAVPLPVKVGVGNVFGNVGDLWVGVNDALQGKVENAGIDVARLLINSTVGIFGLFDVATELGLERHDEDLGQTLAVWGVGDGPYLYLPIFGPRTMRDTLGWLGDVSFDPVDRIEPVAARNSALVTRFVDIRASLLPADKMLEEAALDKYSYVRDAYLQRRRSLIHDGRPPRLDD